MIDIKPLGSLQKTQHLLVPSAKSSIIPSTGPGTGLIVTVLGTWSQEDTLIEWD